MTEQNTERLEVIDEAKSPIEIYKFETLYGKDIKGKVKTWQLKVERYPT